MAYPEKVDLSLNHSNEYLSITTHLNHMDIGTENLSVDEKPSFRYSITVGRRQKIISIQQSLKEVGKVFQWLLADSFPMAWLL